MSRASDLLKQNARKYEEGDVVEVDYSVTCSMCYQQADVVKYNTYLKLLFWVCPNGHKDFLEDFEI
jgi:hypothetical protein